MGELFNGLLRLIAHAIVTLHDLTGPVFGEHSGLSWAFAIVLLTICIRLLMYPLFVKQIKTQRAMTALQPKIKELQAKHKGDKETLNVEMMKLYKEHNANPFAGCLPVLLQMPIFIALYQVLNQLAPKVQSGGGYDYPQKTLDKFDLSRETVNSFMSAKIFDAPIGAGFKSPARLLEFLGGSAGAAKVVAVTLIVGMALTTFLTSKQMMGRNPNMDSSQATQQKVLLYLMPVLLGVFGFQVAIGVLVYWTTTNLFSMAQQAVVIRHLGPPEQALAAEKAKAAAKTKAAPPAPRAAGKQAANAQPAEAAGQAAPKTTTGAAKRPATKGKNRGGKGQRRGGRH